MDIALKIVTRLPLHELWRGAEFTTTARGRWLNKNDITDLLHAGPVQFVVVEIGMSPRWVELRDCYDFWKSEAEPHLADPESKSRLEEFLDEYLYFASKWESEPGAAPIVLLEKHH